MPRARPAFAVIAGLALAAAAPVEAGAQGATLHAVSCFPQGSYQSARFERFIAEVNEAAKGTVQITYRGGAPAIGSPLSVVQKLSTGVYDLVSCVGAYYQNVVPEADAWKLQERTQEEVRQNGGWDLMQRIHREKNLVLLGRPHFGTPFHLYLGAGRKIAKPELAGLHLRVSPLYLAFFKAMGATTQSSDLAQIYSLMENGTVHGYGWPVTGLQPGWERVTKYRVDPGFYNGDMLVIANAGAWDKLSPAARDALLAVAIRIEKDGARQDAADVKAAIAKQNDLGIEAITLQGEDARKWLGTARQSGWDSLIQQSPQTGPQLRKLFAAE